MIGGRFKKIAVGAGEKVGGIEQGSLRSRGLLNGAGIKGCVKETELETASGKSRQAGPRSSAEEFRLVSVGSGQA